ncbi:hypothetical protein [Vibrio ezurae]|uniref:Uncharacterized protein n=1 Tax=Vibrio ezurae NBRC 102218 TaxID=1219080 RepID=U3CPZ8_9VIBR|nr:hypothetical protein [Vibrio ezurae]GAD80243.1 hypothetical protein VEZ01S_28_00260 [Vibrio ezurae NBRC 102218]
MPSDNALFTTMQSIGFAVPKDQAGIACDASHLNALCERLLPLYQRSKTQYPQHTDQQLLLGLLTLHREKQLQQLRSQHSSLLAMQQVIDDSLENEHANCFKSPLIIDIWLSMHLWLFVQGQMKIDYSLACDYATETSDLLVPFLPLSANQLRSDWLKSYYEGKETMQALSKQNRGIGYWVRRVLKKSNQ